MARMSSAASAMVRSSRPAAHGPGAGEHSATGTGTLPARRASWPQVPCGQDAEARAARARSARERGEAMPPSTDVVSVERLIPAPAEKIFDLLADPARHCDIDGSGTVRAAKTGSERLGLGSKFGMSMKAGFSYSMVSEVIEFDENRCIAWQSKPPS